MANEIKLAYAKTGATVTCKAFYDVAGTMTQRAGVASLSEDENGVYSGDAADITLIEASDLLVYYDDSVIVGSEIYLDVVGADNDTLKTISNQIDSLPANSGYPYLD